MAVEDGSFEEDVMVKWLVGAGVGGRAGGVFMEH